MHQHGSHPLHGELDGRVGDEHEGGLGAVPQGGNALLHPDLPQTVEKTPVPELLRTYLFFRKYLSVCMRVDFVTCFVDYLGARGSRPAILRRWLTTHSGFVSRTLMHPRKD